MNEKYIISNALNAVGDLILSLDHRLTALEKSCCTASPEPSATGAAAGNSGGAGGTTAAPSATSGGGTDAVTDPPAAKGEARVPEFTLIGDLIPDLEAERLRLARLRQQREGDAWSRLCGFLGLPEQATLTIGREVINAFVAGECERAVREDRANIAEAVTARLTSPKPDAGRAEGVKCPRCGGPTERFPDGLQRCDRRGCHWWNYVPATPATKPSPGEVAEGIFRQAFMTYGPIRDALVPLIEAAIVRERSPLGH